MIRKRRTAHRPCGVLFSHGVSGSPTFTPFSCAAISPSTTICTRSTVSSEQSESTSDSTVCRGEMPRLASEGRLR